MCLVWLSYTFFGDKTEAKKDYGANFKRIYCAKFQWNKLFQGIAKLPFIDDKLLLSATKTVEKDLTVNLLNYYCINYKSQVMVVYLVYTLGGWDGTEYYSAREDLSEELKQSGKWCSICGTVWRLAGKASDIH
jgi:hypothetical protein